MILNMLKFPSLEGNYGPLPNSQLPRPLRRPPLRLEGELAVSVRRIFTKNKILDNKLSCLKIDFI